MSSSSKIVKQKKFALQCLKNWPLFLISLFFSLSFAVYYLYTAQPQYTREAQLLIKEESKNRTTSVSDLNAITDLGVFSNNSNVNNELGRIQSLSLLTQVVKELHLDVDYLKVSFLRKRTLYGEDNPIIVEILGLEDNDNCEFEITLDSASFVSYAKKDIEESTNNAFTQKDSIKSSDESNKPKFSITALKCGKDEIEGTWNGKVGNSIVVHKKLRVLVSYNNEYNGYKNENTDIEFPSKILVVRRGLVKSVEYCKQKLGVALIDKKSTILNLSYSDANSHRAEDVLIALIKAYNDNLLEGKNKIALSTSQFINERLSLIERELGNVDENISTYKSRNLTPDVDEVAKLHLDKASQAQDKVSELDAQLAMLEYIRDFIANNHDKQFLPAVTNITNSVIEKGIDEYNALLLKRNNLAANSSDRNPMVVSYDKNLEDMAKVILISIDSQIDAIDSQIVSLRRTEAKSKAKIASSPIETKYLLGVERQQKVKEALYLFLLQKREENELSQAFSAYNNQIITRPTGKLESTSPIKKNILIVALMLGILIPAGISWILMMVRGKIEKLDDLNDLPIDLLGEVPYSEKEKIVISANKKNDANKAFRNLRTNIETSNSEEEIKSILLTDLDSRSGKGYVAANLAKVFALKQKRVALVNFDCNDDIITTLLSKNESGVYDFLSENDASWQNYIHQSKSSENLFVMPAGSTPENPSDLLNGNKLQTLTTFLKSGFDMVVINCPTAIEESATSFISKFVDKNIFVLSTESNLSKSSELISNYITEDKLKNISVVLNRKIG